MKSLRSSQKVIQLVWSCPKGKPLVPSSLRRYTSEASSIPTVPLLKPEKQSDIGRHATNKTDSTDTNAPSSSSGSQKRISTDPLRRRPPTVLGNFPDLIQINGSQGKFNKTLLRDACNCSKCVDPSSTQKNYQTTDIPLNIEIRHQEEDENGNVRITWENDVPGFGPDHVSVFSKASLDPDLPLGYIGHDATDPFSNLPWDAADIKNRLEYINYEDYMTSDETLHRALWLLGRDGLLFVRGVPDSETAVEDIATRVGKIRDTFYGRTWDVKSVPDAKNVAYTPRDLGLHMDLLYMANPPGFQLLHCLKNSAKGGSSVFADGYEIALRLDKNTFRILAGTSLAYQYKNAGEHYFYSHPVIETARGSDKFIIRHINYSPPFQAPYSIPRSQDPTNNHKMLGALYWFARVAKHRRYILDYKMEEGECVIFNNRRVLHGRKAFDSAGGERWLKGTYLDTDVVASRLRVFTEQSQGKEQWNIKSTQRVFPHGARTLEKDDHIV